jgi:hypothetical protein
MSELALGLILGFLGVDWGGLMKRNFFQVEMLGTLGRYAASTGTEQSRSDLVPAAMSPPTGILSKDSLHDDAKQSLAPNEGSQLRVFEYSALPLELPGIMWSVG